MKDVIIKYVQTALIVVLILGAGLLLGYLARKCPALTSQTFRATAFLLGTGMLLVAGIGRLGYSIQTFDGETPAEILDGWIFWTLSVLGTLLLVFDFAVGKWGQRI